MLAGLDKSSWHSIVQQYAAPPGFLLVYLNLVADPSSSHSSSDQEG